MAKHGGEMKNHLPTHRFPIVQLQKYLSWHKQVQMGVKDGVNPAQAALSSAVH